MICVFATAIAGAIIAPRIDAVRPWFNYEAFAEKLEPNKAEAFSWNHSYGPLNWSRDGREMLRIKAKTSVYWKATNLDDFDGVRWLEGPPSRDAPDNPQLNPRWLQKIDVVDRGLRSTQFVGAGTIEDILPGASRLALPQSDGTFVTPPSRCAPATATRRRSTSRGPDSQLGAQGTTTPATQDFLEMRVPLRGASGVADQATGGRWADARCASPYGRPGPASCGQRLRRPAGRRQRVTDSPYAQLYALTQQIRRTTQSPYDFVQPSGSREAGDHLRRAPAGARTRWPRSSSTPRPATASSSPA
jgi:hypothetical protein